MFSYEHLDIPLNRYYAMRIIVVVAVVGGFTVFGQEI